MTLTTHLWDYTLIVRTYRGEGKWEVKIDDESIACSTVWEPVADALDGVIRATIDLALDAIVAGIAPAN